MLSRSLQYFDIAVIPTPHVRLARGSGSARPNRSATGKTHDGYALLTYDTTPGYTDTAPRGT
jgi:hypothetical protein